MGLFRRNSFRRRKSNSLTATTNQDEQAHSSSRLSKKDFICAKTKPDETDARQVKQQQQLKTPPSLDNLPQLLVDLQTHTPLAATAVSSANKVTRLLTKLFSLSELDAFEENRIRMAQQTPLVAILLELLETAATTKNFKQYFLMALLVLNNLSVPMPNKRTMIVDYDVVTCMSRMLVQDVSCHLIAIVLVNLTFCEFSLRMEILQAQQENQLFESLAYSLRMASLTPAVYHERLAAWEVQQDQDEAAPKILSVKERLTILLAANDNEYQARLLQQEHDETGYDDSILEDDTNNLRGPSSFSHTLPMIPPKSQQAYSETVRWTLTALKNMSRPCKDPSAAQALVSLGMVPLIMGFLAMEANVGRIPSEQTALTTATSTASDIGDDVDEDALRVDSTASLRSNPSSSPIRSTLKTATCRAKSLKDVVWICCDSPETWHADSSQDAASTILINLAAVSSVRDYLVSEVPAVLVLSAICNFKAEKQIGDKLCESEMLVNQKIKARMGLAYLLGSRGHFGQAKDENIVTHSATDKTVLLLSEPELVHLVAILSNSLHRNSAQGSCGYSAHAFSVKYVLFAIRCLVTQFKNQVCVVRTVGAALNTLLVKILAQHALMSADYINAEAAEHACFSLYLLSNHCFQRRKGIPFLPVSFADKSELVAFDPDICSICEMRIVKILAAYIQRLDITPAGKHAAEQLLMRVRYLWFHGSSIELAERSHAALASDYELDATLCEIVDMMTLTEPIPSGARPDANVFDRSLLRRCALGIGSETETLAWDNDDAVDMFETALEAAQEFSFSSSTVRHLNGIDDVLIANNIAHSAMGDKTESYTYMWSWKDKAKEIQKQLTRESTTELIALTCHGELEQSALPSSTGVLDKLFAAFYQCQ